MALASLVLLGVLALGWRWIAGAEGQVVPTVPVGAAEAVLEAELADEELAPVAASAAQPSESTPALAVEDKREAAAIEEAWPAGFSQLVVRVHRAGRPVRGARVTVVGGSADRIVFGEGSERLGEETNDRGQVAFFVRPTRTAIVSALDGETGWSQEGTFTTSFEGRSRMVELDMGAALNAAADIQVVSELDGLPLAGVKVEASRRDVPLLSTALTNERGVVSVPAGPDIAYQVSLDRFVTKEIAYDRLALDGATTVTLRPLARVYGVLNAAAAQAGSGTERSGRRSPQRGHTIRLRWGGESGDEASGSRIRYASGRRVSSSGSNSASNMAAVEGDGSWSIDVAVPETVDSIVDASVHLVRSLGGGHLADLKQIRPGDEIEIADPWAGADPFTVTFTGPDTAKLVRGAVLHLRTVDSMTSSPADSHHHVDSSGVARIPRLPVGEWHYRVEVSGVRISEQIQGRFFRAAGEESLEIEWEGRVVELSVRTQEKRVIKRYQVGIAPAGGIPPVTTRIRTGERRALPVPATPGAYDVVLLSVNWTAQLNDPEDHELEVKLRVPLGSDTRSLVLRP